jgi:internalin A
MSIPDSALESVLRERINKPLGQFMASEIAMIDVLNAEARGIADLTGIEYCENLTILHVSDNDISDLSPLARLKNLRILGARNNLIADLGPLAHAVLFQLIVPDNDIVDVAPIATMPDIRVMALHNNLIVDIAPLVASPYIGPDDQLNLTNNPLSEQSLQEYIPALQARLVLVIH